MMRSTRALTAALSIGFSAQMNVAKHVEPGDESQRGLPLPGRGTMVFRRQPAPCGGGDGPALVRVARPDFIGTRCLPWRSCEGAAGWCQAMSIDAEQWFG